MSRLMHYRAYFAAARLWMPLLIEVSVTLASGRMALLFFTDSNYFERFSPFYTFLVQHFPSQEWQWGLLATLACSFKLAGMLCLARRHSELFEEAAFMLREIGWGASVVLWSTLSLSITVGDPWSLGSIVGSSMAILSLGAMLMGPAMPDDGPAHGP